MVSVQLNEMNQTKTILEQVSALADGQLDDAAVTRLLELWATSPNAADAAPVTAQVNDAHEAQAAWQRYHLIGDVLRSGQHAPCSASSVFVGRLRQRLADEAVATPRAVLPMAVAVAVAPAVRPLNGPGNIEAANAPLYRWKLVAGVASLALAVAAGWNWVGNAVSPAGGQLAQTQGRQAEQPVAMAVAGTQVPSALPPAATAVPVRSDFPVAPAAVAVASIEAPRTMLRNARLDELLAAHQQAAGGLPTPSIFLRNATFEGPSR